MREYTKKPENQSRTLDSNSRASRQAPISDILQVYKNGTLGREAHRQETEIKSKNIIQRVLKVGELEDVVNSEGDIGIQEFIDDGKIWKFRTLDEAKNVGKMVKTMKTAAIAGQYTPKNETELGLNSNLYQTLKYFRDPDHPVPQSPEIQGYDSKGKYSKPFDVKEPDSFSTTLDNPNIKDDNPTPGRINEALVTAIKLKSMTGLAGNHKLYSAQAVDYILENVDTEKQYGFDPFELPKKTADKTPLLNNDSIKTWLNDTYDKHVRTKKINVGKEGKKAYYSGLLDVSGINIDQLNFVLNKIYDYEQTQSTQIGYEAPHLSLINSWLTENNIADFKFPQEFNRPEQEPVDFEKQWE
ncbi:MAG: hypothetical protein RR034_03075 [Bacteroidales bacterium]